MGMSSSAAATLHRSSSCQSSACMCSLADRLAKISAIWNSVWATSWAMENRIRPLGRFGLNSICTPSPSIGMVRASSMLSR